jgi:hypothetical protein
VAQGDIPTQHSGRIREVIEENVIIHFMDFYNMIRKKEEMNLISFTEKHANIEGKNYFKKIDDADVIKGLELLTDLISSPKFVKFLENKKSEIEDDRKEIVNWFRMYYSKYNLIEISVRPPLGSLGPEISKLIDENNISKLVSIISELKMDFPENAQLFRLAPDIAVLYNPLEIETLYVIKKEDLTNNYYKLSLNIIKLALNQIRKKLSIRELSQDNIKDNKLLIDINKIVIPLSRLLYSRDLQEIASNYNIMIKKLDIIDAYKSFSGLDFSRIIWSD